VVRTEQQIWLLYALTVLQLSISAFFEPTRAALLPSLVAKKDLVTANALAGTTWSTMLAFGAALGGLATALLGITAAFLVDAATGVLSAWCISRIILASGDSGRGGEANQETGWYAFVDGLRYLHQRPAILIIALVKASAALAFGGMAVLEVTFAESYFPIGTDGSGTLGLIYLVAGLGTGLGPLVAQRITGDNPNAMKWTILLTYIAMIIGYGLMNRAFTLPLLLIATFVRTAGSGTSWVYSSALLQMFIPDKFLGRVFAFDFAMMTLAASTSTLWVGWARDSLGLDPYQISLALGFVPVVMSVGWLAYIFAYPKEQQALSL
jgi:hypothetical protein